MKKFLSLLLAMIIPLSFFACKDNKNIVRINEVTHSIFYAPFYLAIEKGYFSDNNINIDLTNGGGSDASMTAILSNGADIALLGPETVIYTYQGGAIDSPKIFAQLTNKDGSFLMSRVEDNNFTWSKLLNKEIIAGRKGGSPAMSLEYALNKNQLYNKQNVTLNFDIQYNLTVAAFEGGTGDYVTMFEPTASEYQRLNKAYIVASVGEMSGNAPFTTFVAKESYIQNNKDLLTKFTDAIKKSMNDIYTLNVEDIANSLINQFPSTNLQSIIDSINSYKRINAWKQDLFMTENDFDNLQNIMINAGELVNKVDYNGVFDSTILNKES